MIIAVGLLRQHTDVEIERKIKGKIKSILYFNKKIEMNFDQTNDHMKNQSVLKYEYDHMGNLVSFSPVNLSSNTEHWHYLSKLFLCPSVSSPG